MLEAIRAVHAGVKRIAREIASEIAEHVGDDPLTAGELDVPRLVAAGKSNKAIATDLKISDSTVDRCVFAACSALPGGSSQR
jgi:DNA-binding NarL/FixJ family response regulator